MLSLQRIALKSRSPPTFTIKSAWFRQRILAGACGNRTHPGRANAPRLVLKTRRHTSYPSTPLITHLWRDLNFTIIITFLQYFFQKCIIPFYIIISRVTSTAILLFSRSVRISFFSSTGAAHARPQPALISPGIGMRRPAWPFSLQAFSAAIASDVDGNAIISFNSFRSICIVPPYSAAISRTALMAVSISASVLK